MALAADHDPSSVYSLEVIVPPTGLAPANEVPVVLRVLHPQTREVVRNFEETHTKSFHLFVLSDDLDYYSHLHPAKQSDGSFTIGLKLPKPGIYRLLADFFPVGGSPQFLQRMLVTAGYRGRLSALANIGTRDSAPKTSHNVRTTLHMSEAVAGREQLLTFEFQDATSGVPVRTLEPYLGAWGHLLVASADRADAFHAHPVEEISSAGGPNVVFQLMFARPGSYRMWLQFQIGGSIVTVPFTVPVGPVQP